MNRKQHQRRSESHSAASGHSDHKRVSRELKRHQEAPKRLQSASTPQDRGVRKSHRNWSGTIAGGSGISGKAKREGCKESSDKNCQKRQQQAHHSYLVIVGHCFCRSHYESVVSFAFLLKPNRPTITPPNSTTATLSGPGATKW